MRWFWIDRFTEFVSGQYATAVKNVTLAEEAVDEYVPSWPYLPASLVIEGMAQTGGLLVGQLSDFRQRVVLGKINRCQFHGQAFPGDTLHFRAQLTSLQANGAFVSGTVEKCGKPFCELELMFAFLTDERFDDVQLFEPAALCRMLRLLRMFEVGVNPDGSPISVPEQMVAAEKAVLLSSTP
ncbi:MAG TPA: 3-hydroxyacyl-ACP dehydratase FabZ family protein [Pirellulaceae bacterium]|nr:3-hydroxyacyl-ACP dehydratase FabZ family protein [Pirellulaceae bacterium]